MSGETSRLELILAKPETNSKKRVAAYCRVSSQKDEQMHSLAAQVDYYTQLLSADKDCEFAGIYADEGISGTRTKNRAEFLRLIEDCRAGKVDAIITKSVSRFGRNTVDTLVFTRELKSMGVDIFFEKENLHTSSSEGELLLTLMAAVAESEAVSMSDNIKWGKRRRYEKGMVDSIALTMLGYTKKGDEICVNEEEAATVRKIYDYFLAGYGYEYIAKQLTADGVQTKRSGTRWANHTVILILTNEKYCGDCLFQKSYNEPLTHKNIRNQGQLPQFLVEDAFPAIIPREEWKAAQELHKRHTNADRRDEEHPFTGLLRCPHCGKRFTAYRSCSHNREIVKSYRCDSRTDHSWVEIPGVIFSRPPRYQIQDPSPALIEYRKQYGKPPKQRPLRCTDIKIPIDQPKKGFVTAWNQLVGKKARYQQALRRTAESSDNPLTRYRAKEMIGLLDSVGRLKEFNFPLMLRTLDYVEVMADSRLSFVFQSGIRLTI